MKKLLAEIKKCRVCEEHLASGCNPVMAAHSESNILIIGHAPGRIVHETGIPWNDKSGDNLRAWMDIDKTTFYDPTQIAIMPMGFCYPGTGKTGDLPPTERMCSPLAPSTIR